MSKKNNRFIINIMMISVVGVIVLMGAMFMVISTYLDDSVSTVNTAVPAPEGEKEVEYSEMMTMMIRGISENNIIGLDIKSRQDFNYKITEGTKIDDGYGNSLLLSQIKKGDIVQVVYQKDKQKLISISKCSEARTISRISGINVDAQSDQISVSGTNYKYTNDTLVLTRTGELIPINVITPFDIVTINSIGKEVFSVVREEEGSNLILEGVPNTQGTFELDRSRIFKISELGEPIGVIPGEHRIIFDMEGYKPISEVITVGEGEIYTISLKDAEAVYSTIIPKVSIDSVQYTIKVDNKVYKKGEVIKVQQGIHTVSVEAEGYKTWVKQISTSGYEEYDLYVYLEKEINDTLPTQAPVVDEVQLPQEEIMKEEQEVNLNTNPVGAKVYINGSYRGETPCSITLKNGSYGIIFEKDGYAPYSTNIMLDGSSDKPGYLYDMIKK